MQEAIEVGDEFEDLAGCRITSVHIGEGGMHIDLDDDRTLVVLGVIAIFQRTTLQ